jgi:HEAT repeat protein
MFRSSRTLVSLIRALMVPAVVAGGGAALVTSVTACKDESQPEYWIEKMEDRAWKPRAVKRLEQFFEDAYTKANKDLESEDVKTLAGQILEPLVQNYVNSYADLDEKTRESLIKLIASFRDKRGEPAFKTAFEEFAKRGRGADDVRWASRAYADLKADSLGDSIILAFDKLRASKDGASAYRDLNEAMLAHPLKSWSGTLKKKLEPEIVPPKDAKEPTAVEKYRDQLFWQTTAAQLLGELQDTSAIDPLLKVMLDPAKADVQATAVLALVKIGAPAVQRTIKILKDQDEPMATHAAAKWQKAFGLKEAPKNKPHIAMAAVILGTIGRPEALDPMIEAARSTRDEGTKAVIARELAKIPATPASKQAFREAYESISLDTVIPPGANALQVLTESAGAFYDPALIPWLIERADKTKGSSDQQSLLQSTATVTAIKLMKPEQAGIVNIAVRRWGTQLEKDSLKMGSELLKACGDRASCYLTAIEKSENQEKATQFTGIKAGYMIGIYGDDKARDGIIERLDSIENAAVRFTAAQTIDFLSPKGSKEAADGLQKIIDKNAKSADKNLAAADAPLKQVMYRIRTRAQ